MLLTDSEQTLLLEEIFPTTLKIEAILKKHGLDKIPGEIAALRQENDKLHKQTQGKIGNFIKSWSNIFSHGKSEFDRP